MSDKQVLELLKQVNDPDLNRSLVELNMIQNIVIKQNNLSFDLVLTTPACPLKEKIKNDCLQALEPLNFNKIDINVTHNVTSMRQNQNLLPSVKNIVCVASGKGGVGKSTVSVNLALSLAAKGAKVGLIDADIHGPSIPTMLGIKDAKPDVREIKGKHYILPIESQGIKVLSIGFLADERQAIIWRGPMVTSAIKQFITDCIWGKLDYLILDLPPGTGDIHLTMAQTIPITGAVIVSTPQQVALADARKAIAMFRNQNINIPILGIIENMAYFVPDDMPNKKYFIFGKAGAEQMAQEYEIPLLGKLPLITDVRKMADEGKNLRATDNDIAISHFDEISDKLAQQIAIKNSKFSQLATQT